MPEKTTKDGRTYEVNGKMFVWRPENDDGEPGDTRIRIPLRIKLKLVRSLGGRELDNAIMFDMLEALIPDQADALDDMDINDFQDMFTAWQSEYNTLTGASLGESGSSSA